MPKSAKKHAKGRLDKFYQMAKEQGYRARSAFKLIQLNRKYDILSKSQVLLDLCAAPGGWLQVAAKYMPKNAIIVGVDLAPIKPIPNVTTFVQDITTDKCRSVLRGHFKTAKVNTVLHDGAPNVGASWLQDAFSQNELVLSSLKLATQFLARGGTFCTKVFRSKDYNKLLWVFNKLFKKVEATKPSSSRSVSAEIFVVCMDFIAPKSIDPRFLDSKWVFKEIDDFEGVDEEDLDEKTRKERQSTILNDLLHPEKRKRHRDGYEDGATTLHRENSVIDFINGKTDHVSLLAKSSSLGFPKDDEAAQNIKSHPLTTKEILSCLEDLKVLGKKDFKGLLRWREHIRLSLGLQKTRKEIRVEAEEEAKKQEVQGDTPEAMAERLYLDSVSADARLKREKKRARERKAKTLLKMRLGMDTPVDIGIEGSEVKQGGFDLDNDELLADGPAEGDFVSEDDADEDDEVDRDSQDESSVYDSDEERMLKVESMEADMDMLYEDFKTRQMDRDPVGRSRAEKRQRKAENGTDYEEWYGADDDSAKANKEEINNSDRDDDDEDEDVLMTDSDSETEKPISGRAKTFFSNPIFSELASQAKPKARGKFERELDSISSDEESAEETLHVESCSEDEEIRRMNSKGQKKQKDATNGVISSKSKNKDEEKTGIEVVPLEKEAVADEDLSDDEYIIKTAQDYTMAQKLVSASGRRELLDSAYNRYAFNDDVDNLPSWFVQDEQRHNKPILPVTKAAIKIMQARSRELDARPIKKVAEAKYRKSLRAERRAEKFRGMANSVAEDKDMPDASKAKNIAKLVGKANQKKKDKLPSLVVAKGKAKGVKGRPNGVKGRYKMVDPRQKKELRAEKRQKKASKPKRRK
ncbi:MAG: hypothetical protein SGCHY_004559 [Lobulomycetales sp.]